MAYKCPVCKTVYYDDPEGGCQGSKQCARGARQDLTWYPNKSMSELEE